MKFKDQILKITKNRWEKAQKDEEKCWISDNRKNSTYRLVRKFSKSLRKPKQLYNYIKYRDFYLGDDWNYWWLEKFNKYSALPVTAANVIEVGCGPFTNARLISKIVDIKKIVCCDPLIDTYKRFPLTWLNKKTESKEVIPIKCIGEDLPFSNNTFDIGICINVLDHVRDAKKCIRELIRTTSKEGYILIGQDLTDHKDYEDEVVKHDVMHPIKIHESTIDEILNENTTIIYKRLLKRSEGRNPDAHYATYLIVAKKYNE